MYLNFGLFIKGLPKSLSMPWGLYQQGTLYKEKKERLSKYV